MITNALSSLLHRRWEGVGIALIEDPTRRLDLPSFRGLAARRLRMHNGGYSQGCVRMVCRQPLIAKVAIEHIRRAQMIRA